MILVRFRRTVYTEMPKIALMFLETVKLYSFNEVKYRDSRSMHMYYYSELKVYLDHQKYVLICERDTI